MKSAILSTLLAAYASSLGLIRDPSLLRGGQASNLSSFGSSKSQARPTYIYVDHWESQLEHADFISYVKDLVEAGASHVLLAFVVPGAGDALDSTGQFDRLTLAEREELKSFMTSNNAKLIMSIGGGNYGTAFMNSDATATATKWCSYARDKGYDGVDWDLEGFTARSKTHPEMEWIKTAVDVCHQYVGLITHAPQAPNIGSYSAYAFEGVIEASTNPSDRFLIQYYNQPTAPYTSFSSIFKFDTEFSASIAEIESRVPSAKGKLVLGKYMYGFGGTGEMSSDALVEVLEQAEATGYTGGVMIWKSPARGTQQLKQFLTTDLPKLAGLGSSPAPTVIPTSPITKPESTPGALVPTAPALISTGRITSIVRSTPRAVDSTPSANANGDKVPCAGANTYDGSVHQKGDHVIYGDSLWRANWYAQNPPSIEDLAWSKLGVCEESREVQSCRAPAYDSERTYATPTEVTYQSGLYKSKWWLGPNNHPSPTSNAWLYLGPCSGEASS